MVFDCVPLFGGAELDVLEVRIRELEPVVDVWILGESSETYSGKPKPQTDPEFLISRFPDLLERIILLRIGPLEPKCRDRETGRLRERFQRDQIDTLCLRHHAGPDDVILFSDLDEIPRARSVAEYLERGLEGVWRFKQRSFYYNVNTQVDYGHDWASRARIGRYRDVVAAGGLYGFRMARKDTEEFALENAGWHFGYFGGPDQIESKVASMSGFLQEYRLFGRETLERDIREGRDLHHRNCELPKQFSRVPSQDLPEFLLRHRDRFPHFFACEAV